MTWSSSTFRSHSLQQTNPAPARMGPDESDSSTRRAKALVQHKDSRKVAAAVEITIRSHRKPESYHHLHQSLLRFPPRLQSIHQHFQSPASISIRRCGKTSKHLFTAIRDRSLKSNPKVRAKARESEQSVAPALVKEMDQVSDQERRETWVAVPGNLVAVVQPADLTMTTTVSLSPVLKLNNARACYSNRNRRTRRKRGGIRSRGQSCCASFLPAMVTWSRYARCIRCRTG